MRWILVRYVRSQRELRRRKLEEKKISIMDHKAIAHDELSEILGDFVTVLPAVSSKVFPNLTPDESVQAITYDANASAV